jgi:hypothetical protein
MHMDSWWTHQSTADTELFWRKFLKQDCTNFLPIIYKFLLLAGVLAPGRLSFLVWYFWVRLGAYLAKAPFCIFCVPLQISRSQLQHKNQLLLQLKRNCQVQWNCYWQYWQWQSGPSTGETVPDGSCWKWSNCLSFNSCSW